MKNKRILISILLIITLLSIVFFGMFSSYNKLKGEVKSIYKSGNDNLSIEIENYNKDDGLMYRNTMQVLINAKFKSDSSKNKKVVISLEEGMTYDSYFVKEGADGITKKQLVENDDLYKAISSVETPEIISTEYYSKGFERYSFGELIYNFNDNITSVLIPINIKADVFRFYGEKNLLSAFKVTTYENNSKLEEISEDILIKEEKTENFEFKRYLRDTTYYKTDSFFATRGGEEPTSFGRTSISGLFTRHNAYVSTSNTEITPYYKEITYHLYYPEGTNFEGFYNSQSNDITNVIEKMKNDGILTIEHDIENSLVKVKVNKFTYFSYGLGIIFSSDEKILNSEDYVIKSNQNFNKIVVKFYDDTEMTFEGQSKYSVKIYDPDTFANKISSSVTNYFDDNDNTTFTFGPMFRIINKTPGEKTNQTLEFVFDDNYQVVAANFPFDTSVASISNIKYKTNKSGDKWFAYSSEWKKNKFTKFDAGYEEDDGIFFTAIKATISLYKENYETGIAAPKSDSNAVLYGNLKAGTEEAYVTLLTYDENDIENTKTELKGTITNIEYKKIQKSTGTGVTDGYFKVDGKDIEVINAGEEFTASVRLRIHEYPYGNVHYLDDTEIYLRQPIGSTINTDNIILIDNDNVSVPYEIKEHTNKFGETIYILKTNFKVGKNFSEKYYEKNLIVRVPIKINLDTKLVSLKLNDLIAWGNNDIKVVGQAIKEDLYDFDGDGDYEDLLFPTGNNTISVLPSKSVIVSTYATLNGKQSYPYDKENPNTIVDLIKSDQFDYVINIRNNTTGDVDNFEMYLPVPKTSNDFKGSLENDEYNWNLSLNNKIASEKFNIEYSIENNKKIEELSYNKHAPEDLSSVRMLKITLKENETIKEAEEISISIPYVIDESRKDAPYYNGKLNVWYPKYKISTSAISGVFEGTGVGLRLFANEISGNTYYDNNANGIYDEGVDKSTSDIGVNLYKLNESLNTYEKIDTKVNYDIDSKEFYIDEYDLKDYETYALEFSVPEKYFVTTSNDNWITGITTNDLFNKDIGIVTYDLDFDTKDYILYKEEEKEINIQNIKPAFFDNVKHNEVAYTWELVDEEDSKYIELTDTNNEYIKVKALEEKENVKVRVSIFDRFGNTKIKEINIKIKESADPIIYAEDQTIDIGNKIEFEKYVTKALNYKEEEIELIWEGNDKNITYEHNAPNIGGYASKTGTYYITYHLTDEYGKTSKTIKLIVDDKFNIKNPSTSDTLSKILLLLASVTTITIIIIRKIKR